MVKLIKHCGFVIAALVACCVVGLFAWLRSGPISNEELATLIASSLSAPDGSFSASVGDARIDWQNLEQLGSITVSKVVLTDKEGNIFANFPKLRASLNPLGWLTGDAKIDEMAVLRPQLYLEKHTDGKWKLGLNADDHSVNVTHVLGSFSGKKSGGTRVKAGFKNLLIYEAQVYISDAAAGTLLQTTNATIRAQRTGVGRLEIQLKAPFQLGDMKPTNIIAAAVLEDGGATIAADFRVDHLPLSLICKFASCPTHVAARGVFTGRIAPMIAGETLNELVLQGIGEDLALTLPDWFEKPILITRGRIDASLRDAANTIELRASELMLADATIRVRGLMQTSEAGTALKAYGETITPLAIEHLYKYWPITKAPQTRNWVNTMLSKGKATRGIVHLDIKPEDLQQENLPSDALRATVDVSGMQVEYLKGFEKVKDLDATIHFTGNSLRVEGKHARFMKDSALNAATLVCEDLYHPRVPMQAELQLDMHAADATKFLAGEHFTFDDSLALSEEITGRIKGNLKLAFDTFSENDDGKPHFENVHYNTALTLENISQKAFAGAFDVANFNGNLMAKEGIFTLDGKGAFDGHNLTVNLAQKGKALNSKIAGSLDVAAVKKLLPESEEFLGEGVLGVSVEGDYEGGVFSPSHAKLDASGASLKLMPISFTKNIGEKGLVTLSRAGEKKSGTLDISANLGALTAKGQMMLDANTGKISSLNIANLKAPGNDFSLRYSTINEGHVIEITGKELDARESYASEENSILADFPKLKLTLDLQTLQLAEIPFTQLHGELNCLQGVCTHANITAIVGKGNIAANIINEAGIRKLSITSGDAGDLFKALDITDRMFGGKMQVSGTYDDAQNPAPLNARLIVNDFTLKNSELLGRIFSIGSLTGLANALTGSGIAFDKLSSDIISKQGVFTLKDGRARGTAMGFTVKGKVDTTTSSLNLKGVLVPAFIVNSLVANIPIIGELAGGEGEGLIAFNYSVKGKYADPQAVVNPLSGLTPGFLRGIFNVFDAPEDDGSESDKESAAPTEAGSIKTPDAPRDLTQP